MGIKRGVAILPCDSDDDDGGGDGDDGDGESKERSLALIDDDSECERDGVRELTELGDSEPLVRMHQFLYALD